MDSLGTYIMLIFIVGEYPIIKINRNCLSKSPFSSLKFSARLSKILLLGQLYYISFACSFVVVVMSELEKSFIAF